MIILRKQGECRNASISLHLSSVLRILQSYSSTWWLDQSTVNRQQTDCCQSSTRTSALVAGHWQTLSSQSQLKWFQQKNGKTKKMQSVHYQSWHGPYLHVLLLPIPCTLFSASPGAVTVHWTKMFQASTTQKYHIFNIKIICSALQSVLIGVTETSKQYNNNNYCELNRNKSKISTGRKLTSWLLFYKVWRSWIWVHQTQIHLVCRTSRSQIQQP